MPNKREPIDRRHAWGVLRLYGVILLPILSIWRLAQLKSGMYFGVNEGLRREHPPQEWAEALQDFPPEFGMILLALGLMAAIQIGIGDERKQEAG